VDYRHLLLVALALVAAGCGQGASQPPAGPDAATVLVTRDFGETTVTQARAAPGQSALNALRRSAKVGTSYGGRFVESINGVEGRKSEGWDWLYFVNGIDPGVGAADTTIHAGDREWWDYRYWKDFIGVPAVIGAWPEPFVHGLDGKRPQVDVQGPACAGELGDSLRQAGARVGSATAPYDVRVATFDEVSPLLSDWQRWAFTVRLAGGGVDVYRGQPGWSPVTGAHAVIAARSPDGIPGHTFELLVAGDTQAAACAAAHTVASNPASIAHTYAVALDANGRVLAVAGRP
jgi:hypothetical protein